MNANTKFSWIETPISGYVYFINFSKESPIKIGFAKNIDKRLGQLQIGNPYELEVLCAAPGHEAGERILHEHLQMNEVRGEWFWPTSYVKRVLRRLRNLESFCEQYRDHIKHVIGTPDGSSLIDICFGIDEADVDLRVKYKNKA